MPKKKNFELIFYTLIELDKNLSSNPHIGHLWSKPIYSVYTPILGRKRKY